MQFDEKIDFSKAYFKINPIQRICGILSIASAITSVILLFIWTNGKATDKQYLGGFNFHSLILDYHPICMVAGMILCSVSSLLTYRTLPLPKLWTKRIHVLLHTMSMGFIIVGLTSVFVGNNIKSYNTSNAYYTNFVSLHSFLGLIAVIVYSQNYVFGLLMYFVPCQSITATIKKSFLPYHIYIGSLSLLLSVCAAETGIMELFGEIGCSYDVSSADLNPAANYHKLSIGCQLANGAGILIIISLILAMFALSNEFPGKVRTTLLEKPILPNSILFDASHILK